MSTTEDRESKRTLADQIFARRMSEHLKRVAEDAEEIARKQHWHLEPFAMASKLEELAGNIRALARIMYNESIPHDDDI